MTIETWKAEFYPIPASECPQEQAIAHSLQKWKGLRAEAVARHEATIHRGDVVCRMVRVFIDSSTCALCEQHHNTFERRPCETCPLAISREGHSCTSRANGELQSPWHAWAYNGNPEPMIAALEKALADQGEKAE